MDQKRMLDLPARQFSREAMSRETMELYQRTGTNPLSSCLPLLLQMPIFIALYWTLMESVELRHAPFALWIHDLSAQDPYYILPILMGLGMGLGAGGLILLLFDRLDDRMNSFSEFQSLFPPEQ